MGDAPGRSGSGSQSHSPQSTSGAGAHLPSYDPRARKTISHDFRGQYQNNQSNFSDQRQQNPRTSSPLSRQNEQPIGLNYSPSSFMHMGALGNALPDYGYPQGFGSPHQHSSFQSAGQGTHLGPTFQVSPHFAGQNAQFVPQHQGVGGGQQPGQRNFQNMQNMAQPYYQYPQAQQQMPLYFYEQGHYVPNSQFTPGHFSQPSFDRTTIQRETTTNPQRVNENMGSIEQGRTAVSVRRGSIASNSAQPSAPRGPPRKPKQSGHALWVGNLPPTANVVELKDHFSRDATEDILSVFLISKSNCAFVNYKTEESCAAAMARFHDSRFRETRLVCRLRRTQVSGVPTGPAAQATQNQILAQPETSVDVASDTVISIDEVAKEASAATDRYFIVKSLTVEDLEMSVRNGQWATQSHNEKNLSKAYESAESVFLIFSANKSGEYFGYARMISQINDDPAAAIEFAPKAQAIEDPEQPKSIPTLATEFAPKGRIIDDSARGTIFWEAEVEDEATTGNSDDVQDSVDEQEMEGESKVWGKPFKIEWLSTTRLPFYRTRGLRNPWNSNREVKIARDGTELETSVGRRLVQMFQRDFTQVAAVMPQMPMAQMGYAPMRPY